MTRFGGLNVLDSFHCEKIAFLTFGAMIGVIYFFYLAVAQNEFPTVTLPIFNETVTWLWLFALILGGGYLGVLYYRSTHNKCIFCKETLFFWTAKA